MSDISDNFTTDTGEGAVLLVTLGTSQALVPEAFWIPGGDFRAVHVLTSESTRIDLICEFFEPLAPKVAWSVSRVAGFRDLRTEEDHFNFEEVLCRWIVESAPRPQDRWICASGGFKTMSAAMIRAATMLGAREVFHVLADATCVGPNAPRQPATIAEVAAARDGGHLHWIRLGAEPGWPQFRAIQAVDHPLRLVSQSGSERYVATPDDGFRRRIQTVVERSHRISAAWDRIPGDLPFAELAAWSEPDLAWLDGPLCPDEEVDRRWVARMPKVELHSHLGGFGTGGELLERVRMAAADPRGLPPLVPVDPPSGWPLPPQPVGLGRYMSLGDNNGRRLLRDPGCLREQCRAIYEWLRGENVAYAEIRCSPNNYVDPARGRDAWAVLFDIVTTFQSSMDHARSQRPVSPDRSGPAPHVNLIVIATRKDGGDRSDISRHLSLAITAADHWTGDDRCRVVGVDLAGFESEKTRAALFASDFEAVHRVGLAVTVHAGENDDAEGIWQAVFKLNARRLGHALHLRDSEDLLRAVAERGIGVEMCPHANVQIRGFSPLNGVATYPLAEYLARGVKVTVNTDNPGISSAGLCDNLLLASHLCPQITRKHILRVVRNGIDTAFASPLHRDRLLADVAARLPLPGG